jgi:3-hydroxybutyryl-CoA dehydrogenase
MKIFISGSTNRESELQQIISKEHNLFLDGGKNKLPDFNNIDLIIDLNLDDHPEHLQHYAKLKGKTVIGCAVKKTLKSMVADYGAECLCTLVGMNALPTFIARTTMELSFLKKEDEPTLAERIKPLAWNYLTVADQTGMVTPRIIVMVINEAFFTLYNGVASVEDIDKGMKLGTAYPLGPFEWANKIGIKDVYETLKAIHESTHDDRYRICPLLKEKYTSAID